VLAPGDGEAEPGVIGQYLREPAKLATDVVEVENLSPICCPRSYLSPTSWARTRDGFGSPGSASPSPGASTLSACFAGSLNHPFYKYGAHKGGAEEAEDLDFFRAIKVVNDAIANQIVGFLVDGIALAKRILDLSSAIVRIKFAEQTNAV